MKFPRRAQRAAEYLSVVAVLAFIFFPYFKIVRELSYIAYNVASDTFFYLDLVRNMLAGRGAVSSFNMYQYWPGVFYPALPLVQMGLPAILLIFYAISPSIKFLISLNFPVVIVALLFFYAAVKKAEHDRPLAFWIVLALASMGTVSLILLRILTEPWSLLLTAAAVYLFVGQAEISRPRMAGIGLLLGANILVRSSCVFFPLVFFVAHGLSLKGAAAGWKRSLALLAWPLLVVVVYELFVLALSGDFFPHPPLTLAYKNYYLASYVSGGSFTAGLPVLHPSLDHLAGARMGRYFFHNLFSMAQTLFAFNAKIFLPFSVLALFSAFKKRGRLDILLWGLAFLQMVLTAATYSFMKLNFFEQTRFLLIPSVCFVILGAREFYFLIEKVFRRTAVVAIPLFFCLVIFSNLRQAYGQMDYYVSRVIKKDVVTPLSELSLWVRDHVPPTGLVAVSPEVSYQVYLDRPVVILPSCRNFSKKNLKDFIGVYHPFCVATAGEISWADRLLEVGYVPGACFGKKGKFCVYTPALDSTQEQ